MPRYELKDGEIEGLRAVVAQEMRNNVGVRDAFVAYAEARVLRLLGQAGAGLLNERESDMLRGMIAELKNIIADVQSTGEDSHGLE